MLFHTHFEATPCTAII